MVSSNMQMDMNRFHKSMRVEMGTITAPNSKFPCWLTEKNIIKLRLGENQTN